MIKLEDWMHEDLKRIRSIQPPDRSLDEQSYLSLLVEYNHMISEFNRKLRKMQKAGVVRKVCS